MKETGAMGLADRNWFKEAQFGMMIHWGLYSLLAGEYRGKRGPGIGEWIQEYFRIPNAEYEKLAGIFNPIYFDAEEWVRTAQDAGMKYMVFTSKHHDGFAMFKSKADPYNIVDATPFGRDPVEELAAACQKYGMKFGLYYSQDLDWHHPHGGGYTWGKTWGGDKAYWTNNWDFPDDAHKNYTLCFEEKIKPQVREILTQYGDLCLIWFDVPGTANGQQVDELYSMVKRYQPECLINSRIGQGRGDYESAGDNFIPEDSQEGKMYETPLTMNGTWGYKTYDNNWKSAYEIIGIRDCLKKRGANLLLNVGPDYLGRIPAPCVDILRETGIKSR